MTRVNRVDESDLRLLGQFPKTRPPLTERHIETYESELARNRGSGGLLYRGVAYMEGWMHRSIVRHGRGYAGPVLELGAGNLNHVQYEPDTTPYDALEPLPELCLKSHQAGHVRQLFDSYERLSEIASEDGYSRIFSTAVLEHLEDLPRVVAESARLLAQSDGSFQAGIPSEGGLGWGLAWRLSTGIAYRLRTGVDYVTLMRHEHINNSNEIESVVRLFFDNVRVRRYPLPGKHLSLYSYIHADQPNLDAVDYYQDLQPSTGAS